MDLRKLCRICFVDVEATEHVDITEYKSNVRPLDETATDVEEEHTILEILQAMFEPNQQITLDLTNELPMICTGCLEECLLHYAYFRKVVISNRQLRQFYNEAQLVSESEDQQLAEFDADEEIEEQLQGSVAADDGSIYNYAMVSAPKKLANEDSLIVSEFLPAAQLDEQDEADSNLMQFSNFEMRTVDYAAVELKHNNLDEYNEANRLLEVEPSGAQAVYKCKYCPLAYSSQQFLKTHVRKSHVCKYCTSAFAQIKQLQEHVRTKHSKHHCVVCSNSFSTNSNLRTHLKRVHCVQLPAQVALLDYRPASEPQQDANYFQGAG